MSMQALDVCLQLARTEAILVRRFDATLGSVHGISFGDYHLLQHLGRAPGLRLRRIDLAERLALTASGVTRSLLSLEKIGLVERQSDPRDARVGYAALTAAGQTLLRDAESTASQLANDLLKSLGPEDLRLLAGLLGQMAGTHLVMS
ncbi:MarR family winged helix-turn-helix transcriptional regulator [Massilia sp. TS11]|uniref:MarR family winged helix-turn-helix transcriptional regulator n=1 Tax=Massilia sp. TS11 TaxID=2908003 RepID=UPI001EDB4FB5|nr:MarR family transcriptional regulator [Massilia sp. TS11]MCG2584431.1 MarR family transcriptional regulator [Massilia sp. TS11]